MYLMEGRKLLYAQVFIGRQKLLKLLLQTLFLCGFLRVSFLFTLIYILGVKKHTWFNTFLSQKWQPIWQEERVGGYEGRKGMIFCMLYPWHRLPIELHKHIARTCNDEADFSIKGKSLHPAILISYLSSYIEYKRVALKNMILKVNYC